MDSANRQNGKTMNEKYFDTVFLDATPTDQFPETFAIVTAFNPMDQILSHDENLKRNQQLLDILTSNGHYGGTIIGSAQDLSHQEPSLLASTSRSEALEIGIRFGQRAIFWVSGDELEIIESSTGITHSAGAFRKRITKKEPDSTES
jgi:hypothetical protein